MMCVSVETENVFFLVCLRGVDFRVEPREAFLIANFAHPCHELGVMPVVILPYVKVFPEKLAMGRKRE